MDSIIVQPNTSTKSEFKDSCDLAAKKSGKNFFNQQRSPLMVYERAAVFLQQLRPNKANSINDQSSGSSNTSEYCQLNNKMSTIQDRVNEIITKHQASQKARRAYLENSLYPQAPPVSSISSCEEKSSLSEYPIEYGSVENFQKAPSSVSIHSHKVTHYEIHECPLSSPIYGMTDEDPIYRMYGNKFNTPMLASASFYTKPEYPALTANPSFQITNQGDENGRLRAGSVANEPSEKESPRNMAIANNWTGPEYRILALIATLIMFAMGKVLTFSFEHMERIKHLFDRLLIDCWVRWGLSSIVQKDKCSTKNVLIFGPIMAVMGTTYSVFWVCYTLIRISLTPAPDQLVKKFNFENYFGKSCAGTIVLQASNFC